MRIALAAALMLWEPLLFAGLAGTVPSLVARGPLAIVEFLWASAAASLSVAAAWALVARAPAATPLARAAIGATVLREIQRLIWTALPSDVIPGTRGTVAAAVIALAAVLAALSARVDRS